MIANFVDAHGIEPIWAVLPIALPPTMITWRSGLIRRGYRLVLVVTPPCGLRTIVCSRRTGWSTASVRSSGQLVREEFDIARGTVVKLMKDMGTQGIIRGKPHRLTIRTDQHRAR